MYRCALAALAATVLIAAPAAAQVQRAFPPTALRGTLVMSDPPDVTLNGKAARLAPGARIRDQNNMLQTMGVLNGQRLLVNYTLEDTSGLISNVWVLRAEEAAVRPWPTTLQEAQTWTFDPATQTWTKP